MTRTASPVFLARVTKSSTASGHPSTARNAKKAEQSFKTDVFRNVPFVSHGDGSGKISTAIPAPVAHRAANRLGPSSAQTSVTTWVRILSRSSPKAGPVD
jgi:hypothetical protein